MNLGSLVQDQDRLLTVSPDDTIEQAAAVMWRHRVGSVVVLEDGEPSGILTERDVLKVVAKGLDSKVLTVRSQMTSSLVTAPEDTDAAEAAKTLAAQGIRHLPVTNAEGRIIGIASMRDLLEVVAIKLEEREAPSRDREVAQDSA